ncbi:hypothetical protein [Amorphus orientalis]|uniref:DUF4145 domain-containing protein n=1 Tax=Amorphus orientalis TaxID=649198 RepID=A0AAE3VL07_9HYPH|nr:hypothetical protein [Amorphus orientalis]MDQ0314104.1 hypothetical protein [Amorphus orientalis]
MSEKFDKISEEVEELVKFGEMLHMAMQYEAHPTAFRDSVEGALGKEEAKKLLDSLPKFTNSYQSWYSRSLSLVKQIIPDRISDFISYYEYPRVRKEIDFQNYMIKDYLQGLVVRRGGSLIADGKAAIPDFVQQLQIVVAAKEALESSLVDIKGIVQADLFDSEIDSARALAKSGYLRAAGAICGVVLEKHLSQVCSVHGLGTRRKNPGIADFNELLKEADIISLPQWRFIQHLSDIRNICDHSKKKDPTADQIEDLLSGSDKVLKTIF